MSKVQWNNDSGKYPKVYDTSSGMKKIPNCDEMEEPKFTSPQTNKQTSKKTSGAIPVQNYYSRKKSIKTSRDW